MAIVTADTPADADRQIRRVADPSVWRDLPPCGDRIAAAMIVRDAEETIETCLASIVGYVDELNVYLAGESSDRTAELVEEFAGAHPVVRWVQGEWTEDFAVARNESFRMVSNEMDWILVLDADDVFHGGENLRRALAYALAEWPEIAWAAVPYLYMPAGAIRPRVPAADYWAPTHVRLIRATVEWEWAHAVHETLRSPEWDDWWYAAEGVSLESAGWVEHVRSDWRENAIRNLRMIEAELGGDDHSHAARHLEQARRAARLFGIEPVAANA